PPLAYEVQTKSRSRRRQVKKSIVLEQCYRNFVLEHENVAEIDYRLMKCNRSYRLVILRKTILAKEGQKLLFPEICYFFYLTNVRTRSLSEVVFDANKKQNKEAGMRMFRYNNIH
ncbi:MAG: hypothetical protein LBC02_01665, partial [Planctomycetaceae bacterium]|nr:hypothetical protein [Planctomycetaceae bacterium]